MFVNILVNSIRWGTKVQIKSVYDTILGLDVLNSSFLVSASGDQTIKLWDISTGRNTQAIKTGKAIMSLKVI